MTLWGGITARLRSWDEWLKASIERRPGRSTRLLASALVLFALYGLPEAQNWRDRLWAAWSVMLFGLHAIAPRGMYDGRLERWCREHEAPAAALLVVFAGVPAFALLSYHFSTRTSLLLAVAVGLATAAFSTRRGRHWDKLKGSPPG